MSALYNKPIVGLIVIALVSIFLSSEFGIQLVESSAVRITVIMVVCLTIAAIYYIMLSPVQEMLALARSVSQGGDLGEAPSSGEDAGADLRLAADFGPTEDLKNGDGEDMDDLGGFEQPEFVYRSAPDGNDGVDGRTGTP